MPLAPPIFLGMVWFIPTIYGDDWWMVQIALLYLQYGHLWWEIPKKLRQRWQTILATEQETSQTRDAVVPQNGVRSSDLGGFDIWEYII